MTIPTILFHQVVEEYTDEDIIVTGKIDDNCHVTLVSRKGSITIENKIDNNCTVTLIAATTVSIGTMGNPGDRKIDNNCKVTIEAGGAVSIGNMVNNHCNVKIKTQASVEIVDKIDDNSTLVVEAGSSCSIGSKIDNNCNVEIRTVGDINIGNKIDDNCSVVLDSLRGAISIRNKIDNHCLVFLTAANNINMGSDGGSDGHINDTCQVFAHSGGSITLGDKIGDNCLVEFRACDDIVISSVVERGAAAYFKTQTGIIQVKKIRDNNTSVIYWGADLIELEPRHQNPVVYAQDWHASPAICNITSVSGEWWQNWGWKYGYVAQERYLPNSLEELVTYVSTLKEKNKTKAVGGAWSFTDASLPVGSEAMVDYVSIEKRGYDGKQRVKALLEGGPDYYITFPYDHQPNYVVRNKELTGVWSQARLTTEIRSGFHLPGVGSQTSIIDTRRLASSLQIYFPNIISTACEKLIKDGRHFFFVEAGITMADLNVLLDHQKPRLAIQASGGSPGATLAGTISTATHGGEFSFPLLIDRVKAIHLVGPGGVEWWIEGSESIANFDKLHLLYPNIPAENFIAGAWQSAPQLTDLTANDVLKAVTVSMGTIGVIYSVVLEVVPAYGIQQITKRIGHWEDDFLDQCGVTADQLRAGDGDANQRVLDFICDGAANGTGISLSNNIYVDLAINPVDFKCWIVNRQVTPELPRQSHGLNLSVGQYETAFSRELTNHNSGIFGLLNNELLARIMDFLNYGRSISDLPNIVGQASRLFSFILNKPPLLANLLYTVNGQLDLNEKYRPEYRRKRDFLGDILTGLLNALMGTVAKDISDITDLSYKVGAIGWSDEGLPGKGFELALPSRNAFTFLQTGILDLVADHDNFPITGYISIRVCPKTETLMGMQQFGDYSIMIEPVGFRSLQSIPVFKQILDNFYAFNVSTGAGGMVHWGLENDFLDRSRFEMSAANYPLRDGVYLTKLQAFKAIKAFIQGDQQPVFDNYFVQRLGLNDFPIEYREVNATGKMAGEITHLCNSGEPWSPVTVAQAIEDIRSLQIMYYVQNGSERVYIQVIDGVGGPYLRTTPNADDSDNLDNLPDC